MEYPENNENSPNQELLKNEIAQKEVEEKLDDLENLIKENAILGYNPTCVRKKSNWSKSSQIYRFDNPDFNPEIFLKDMPDYSPKLNSLMHKIEQLDKEDKRKHGKLFKHFIFSDLKSSAYGAKMIASAFVAKGYTLGYESKPKNNIVGGEDPKGPEKKRYHKIELLEDEVLQQTLQNNFYILSSVGVYDQPIPVILKKEMLKKYNQRPKNIQGENIRFIILDSGFKEGIDLFDIKYIHIFEPSIVSADQKQVIGRGTRTCGQKGLDFHPTQGWILNVFVYDLSIPEKLQKSFLNTKSTMELYFKSMDLDIRLINFAHDIERTTVLGSVDYELNKNVHSFSIPFISADEEEDRVLLDEHVNDDVELLYGGSDIIPKKRKLIVRPGPPINRPLQGPLGFEKMREFIRDNYSEFAWDKVKMENLCDEKNQKGGNIIKYTPTQDFIRHYFNPAFPMKGMLLHHSVGTGKCHAKDTPILMYDGSIKMVQNVLVDDELMGDDSTPRKVLSLANGIDDMYDVIPVKGEKYRVNSEHILCLKYTGKGSIINVKKSQPNSPFKTVVINNKTFKLVSKSFETKEEAEEYLTTFKEEDRILEIEVKDYFKLSESLRKDLKGYRKGVEFQEKQLSFDPYIIGLWLGDGSKRGSVFSSQDAKILKYLRDNTRKYGLLLNYQSGYDYRLSKDGTTKTNLLMDELNKYDLINNKHIPYEYKCNSRENRLKLLAGLLDSDGYYCSKGKIFEVSQKLNILANDIIYLARSLGYAAYLKKREKSCMYKGEKKTGIYNNICISGDNLDEIPTILTRKRAEKRLQKKDVLSTGVNIVPAGKGEYFGFCIDGNRRYLIGDFTVTHNTCSAIAAATQNFEKNGYTILWVTRTTLKSDIWKNMFDQICNETIRNMIKKDNLEIPNDQEKRMRLLSKAWRIRPMSYKQFSNLILRQNALYDTLVKINGKEDPLRKTLLVIDEAHKLYGGDDLSSIEKPDMNAFHQALMYSYQYSGADSVRLLLMTATPITKDPMELIQLLNLCKPAEQQMPADFSNFSTEYLNENGEFTDRGRTKYLDDIAGLVSYLNREKDARQFSQPQIHHVNTPIISDIKMAEKFDKKLVQDLLDTNVSDLREQIQEENEKLEGELGQVNAEKFAFLKDEICGDKSGPSKSQCIKIVNAGIRDMVLEAKDQVKDVREKIKEIRERIKERGQMKKTALAEVKENIEKYADEYEKYKSSLLYELKDSCAIKIGDKTTLDEKMHEHPVIHKYDLLIKEYNDEIKDLDQQLKNLTSNYKKRMEHLKHLLKTDLNDVERSVVNSTIRDEQKEYGSMIRLKRRETEKAEKVIKTNISNVEKKRTQRYNKVRKTVKNMITNEKQRIREYKQEKKMLRKTMKSQQKNIKHDFLKGLINKYRSRILEDLVDIDKNNIVKNENKIAEKEEKEKMKIVKKAAKEEEKIQKENNKTMKKREREEDKNRKDKEKEMEKTRKNREKEEDKKRKIKEKEEEKARKMREKEMKKEMKKNKK
jgi:hypothetical protein